MRFHIRDTCLIPISLVNYVLAQSTVSLSDFPEFLLLRTCTQSCIWGYSGAVADVIGCQIPWYDAWVCDTKQQESAASHVSSCVQSRYSTGNNVDAPTAVAVYTDYCYSAGFSTTGQASPTMSLDLKTNACVCNVDQQSAIAKNVGNCVTTRCTSTQDVATVVKVYTGYCSGAGYQAGVAPAKIVTSSAGALPTTAVVTVPNSPNPTT
ncbi:hypothetical protein B0J14DRAFT_644211 [Halenospora varia]|nr:hypothetical protein B0J14DRAFT_644211 [Halenospora varia]